MWGAALLAMGGGLGVESCCPEGSCVAPTGSELELESSLGSTLKLGDTATVTAQVLLPSGDPIRFEAEVTFRASNATMCTRCEGAPGTGKNIIIVRAGDGGATVSLTPADTGAILVIARSGDAIDSLPLHADSADAP